MAVRSRWVALGASLAMVLGAGGVLTSAAGSTVSSFVPITPCRLFDTRAGSDNVGPRAVPLGAGDTHVSAVWGDNGNCSIPSGATGVTMNVAIVNPTAPSFLTVFPADAVRPLAANLNWVAGQAPTPNAVTAALSTDGRLAFYNLTGTVDLAVDINGYYVGATPSVKPARVLWVATSGGDYTTVTAALTAIGTSLPAGGPDSRYLIRVAPGTYTESAGIDLEDYVDIEGSGQNATIITCACGSNENPLVGRSSALLRALGPSLHTEVRDLTVENTGAAVYSTGIWTGVPVPGQVSLRNVTVTASGGTTASTGVVNVGSSPHMTGVAARAIGPTAVGVLNAASSRPMMVDVIAGANGSIEALGVFVSGASPTMINLTAAAYGTGLRRGVQVEGVSSLVVIRDSFVSGTNSIYLHEGIVRVSDTMLDGPTSGVPGPACTNTYNTVLANQACV